MLILDFNDSELRFAQNGKELASAPGFAVLEGNEFILGAAAAAKSRLNPRATYRNFWEQLDQQPLNRAAGRAQSHADIAYFHLQDLWKKVCARTGGSPESVIVVVPSQYGAERLSLLLGIAGACAIPVQGVVDSAVLAASAQAHLPCQYLDISQHRVYRSEVGLDGAVQSADELGQQGLMWCFEQCIKWIATRFMAETRFDPLHEAVSEQRLFDELPRWLSGFADADRLPLSLTAGQRQHQIEVSRGQLIEQLQPLYQAIEGAVQHSKGAILLSHRFSVLPGLKDYLNARVLAADAVFTVAAARATEILSDSHSPVWVKHLPPQTAGDAVAALHTPDSAARTTVHPMATHVLHRHSAYPLGLGGLALGAEPSADAAGEGSACVHVEGDRVVLKACANGRELRINGNVWSGTERSLQLGDEVQYGPERYQLICVRGGH
ncbi:MAG TPA: hypothetical protein DIW43_11370 [Spongiibacteraceae bacterium]|nr:hypothetical protein [Spongiibacteraceae bacterium]HCS28046.1 hypothetical protein [Spongiibacteraceae bacterium]